MRIKIGLSAIIISSFLSVKAQNIGINGTGAVPNSSAMLDVSASNKGLLIPRVALTATNSNLPIGATIVTSLLIYNTVSVSDVTPGYYYWNGSVWERFLNTQTADWALTGNAGTASGTNFIGTIDAIDFVIKTNNIEQMRMMSGGNIGIGVNNPSTKLQVSGVVAASTNLTTQFSAIGEGGIELFRNTTNDNGYIDFRDAAADDYDLRLRFNTSIGTNGAFQISTTTDGTPSTDLERLTILNENGNVGIGTNTPIARLDAKGIGTSSTTYGFGVRNSADSYILIVRDDSRVGIGTITPNAKLEVSGTFVGAGPGSGANSDAPTQAIITDINSNRFNDWPSGWSGGLSTWDIIGASAQFTTYMTRSDRKFKKKITNFNSEELTRQFLKIRPVSYFLDEETLPSDNPDRKHFGFIANEVEEVFPNLVLNAGEPENITRGIEYDGFIPVLVSMVQQQQKLINNQQKLIELQDKKYNDLLNRLEKLEKK